MFSHLGRIGRWTSVAWIAAVIALTAGAVMSAAAAVALGFTSGGTIDDVALVADDVVGAASRIATAEPADIDESLRHIRNALDAEAVSLVAPDGHIMRSTAASLERTTIDPESVGSLAAGEVSAREVDAETAIDVDGVVEWMPGSTVVVGTAPLGDGNGVAIAYDPADIEARRAEAAAGSSLLIPLVMFAIVFGLSATLLETARRQTLSSRDRQAVAEAAWDETAIELQDARVELDTERGRNQLRARSTLSITYEQQTLLAEVLTGVELLSKSLRLGSPERELLEDLIADAARLEALTDQMLVAAGADEDGLRVEVRLHALSTVVDKLRRADPRANVSITGGLRDLPVDVATDVTTLSQLVASLVDNSYSHGADRVEIVVTDSIPGTVHHRIGPSVPAAIYVAVVDDGPGIDRDFLPRAFEPFETGGPTHGRGMGLYLARTMVEAIGASLSVITSPKGTVMAIAMPARAGERAA